MTGRYKTLAYYKNTNYDSKKVCSIAPKMDEQQSKIFEWIKKLVSRHSAELQSAELH